MLTSIESPTCDILLRAPHQRTTANHLQPRTLLTLDSSEAQPFFSGSPYGISMSVNGNLVNAPELVHFLDSEARRHVNTDSDSELLCADPSLTRPLANGF